MTESEIRQLAKEELARNTQACLPPQLDDADLEALLDGAQNATVWQPDTFYAPGAVIVPDESSANGYLCVQGGTTGSAPPAWPAYGSWYGYGCGWSGNPALLYSCFCGGHGTVTDGTVTWQSVGLIQGFYDIAQATSDGWLLKCAKASTLIQTSSAGQSTASHQLFDHCQSMAAQWEPYKVA